MSEEPIKYNKYEVQSLLGLDNKSEFKMERIFDMFKQQGSKHFHYNILQKIEFPKEIKTSLYTIYHTKQDEGWTNLSYRFYKRIDLWWMIAGINNVADTFMPLPAGTRLKIPTPAYVRNIIDSIKTQL